MFYDRNPESICTVPGVCAAGRDSIPLAPGICSKIVVFFENSEVGQKIDPGASRGALRANFWIPWPKTVFLLIFNLFFFPRKRAFWTSRKS